MITLSFAGELIVGLVCDKYDVQKLSLKFCIPNTPNDVLAPSAVPHRGVHWAALLVLFALGVSPPCWPQALRGEASAAASGLTPEPLNPPRVVSSKARLETQLPSLGDGSEMGLAEESRIGESVVKEIFRDPDFAEDAVLVDYIQSLWQPLIQAASLRGELSSDMLQRFAWQVLLIKDPSINAFALPGGYMGVHLGLLGVVSNQDELASVLAHELSHITQRHLSRLFAQQSQQTPLLIGAMLLGVLAASKSPNAASALMVGGQAVTAQNQLNFSRDMEREADRVGYGVMTQAGFEGAGFASMFLKLQQGSRFNDNGQYPYLRSHPLTTERIADMQSRSLGGDSNMANINASAANWSHLMMSARARVLTRTQHDALRQHVLLAQHALSSPQEPLGMRLGALYAGVLASAYMNDFNTSEQMLERLQSWLSTSANEAARYNFTLLRAEVALMNQAPEQTIALLEPLSHTRARLLLLNQARLHITPAKAQDPARNLTRLANLAAQSVNDLHGWVVLHPRDAQAWELLSQAQRTSLDALGATRSLAESFAVKFDVNAAVDRMIAAQNLAKQLAHDHLMTRAQEMEASIIDTRLRELLVTRREQSLQR
jgi:predicted Zn-dependent protease